MRRCTPLTFTILYCLQDVTTTVIAAYDATVKFMDPLGDFPSSWINLKYNWTGSEQFLRYWTIHYQILETGMALDIIVKYIVNIG